MKNGKTIKLEAIERASKTSSETATNNDDVADGAGFDNDLEFNNNEKTKMRERLTNDFVVFVRFCSPITDGWRWPDDRRHERITDGRHSCDARAS